MKCRISGWLGVEGAQVLLLSKLGVNPRYRNPYFECGFFWKKSTPPPEYQGVWGGISVQGGVEGGQVCNPPRDGGGHKKRTLYFDCG